jgi:hypothetical protein
MKQVSNNHESFPTKDPSDSNRLRSCFPPGNGIDPTGKRDRTGLEMKSSYPGNDCRVSPRHPPAVIVKIITAGDRIALNLFKSITVVLEAYALRQHPPP